MRWAPRRLNRLLLAAALLCLTQLSGLPGHAGTAGSLPTPATSAAPAALQLDARTIEAAAWPVLRILEDPGNTLGPEAARQALPSFKAPKTPYQNLGQRSSAVWLHVPLEVDARAQANWVARIEYPLLNEVDFVAFDSVGRLLHHSRTGSTVPFNQRGLSTRALTADLHLPPGQRYDILVRVRTMSASVVPLHFMPWSSVTARESRDQIRFGLLAGLMVFMLAYSLSRWLSLRQPTFLAYAALLCANTLFALSIYGFGAQYVWPDSTWLATHMSAGSSLAVVAANLYFCLHALEVKQTWPRVARLVQGLAALALVGLACFALGWISYRQTAVAASVGAVIHVLLLLPVVVMRWQRDDRAAPFLLLGWLSYACGMILLTAVLRGLMPATDWTLHGAQLGAIGEMLSWLVVLGLRVEHLRQADERARREHDLLHALAHTDPLTGLANRRGLELALRSAALGGLQGNPGSRPLTALYLLDLDGFKQINDELGHEAGDAVLTTIANQLRAITRPGDVIARVGGDEFVVVAAALRSPADAADIGQKLLAQFAQPQQLAGGRLRRVGVTIGYSLASGPVRDAAAWMREADAAMYAGKQAGKHCVTAYAGLPASSRPARAVLRPA